MKENNLDKWVNLIPNQNGILEEEAKKDLKLLGERLLLTSSSEEWRLTNISRFEEFFKIPFNKNKSSVKITLDNKYNLEDEILPSNIQKMSKSEIRKYFSENPPLERRSNNILASINNIIDKNIIAIKVTGGELNSLEISSSESKEEEIISSRIILVLENNCSVNLLQVIKGSKSSSHSHLIDIFLTKNAKLNHSVIAIGDISSKLLSTVSVRQEEHSEYSLNSFQEGWFFSRLEQHINQLNGKAKTNIKGLQISKNIEQLSTYSFVNFNGPDGHLEQIQKSISDESSHSIFKGLIEVPKIAQKTKASQLSKNLLLSNKAKIDTSPQLKITADDVQCNHGATISQLNEDEIFYLQSRGINKQKANNLILNGFCKDIIDLIPFKLDKWSHLSKYLANTK